VEEQRKSGKQASSLMYSREEERLRVIKEHVDSLREFMEKLRRKFN
jgi:hypothetical protein